MLETKHKKLTKNKGIAERENTAAANKARAMEAEHDVLGVDEAARYRKKKTEDIWGEEDLTPEVKPVSERKELSRKKAREAAEFLGVEEP